MAVSVIVKDKTNIVVDINCDFPGSQAKEILMVEAVTPYQLKCHG